jgi:uncharacterized protein (TIGR02001 family)
MNKFNKSLIVLSLLSAAPLTMAEVSGTATVVSDYVFRGVSQSAENVAVQVSLDYGHESGFYAGAWGSNVDFGPAGEDFDESIEIDYYLGFANSIGDSGIDYDVSYLYYSYPGADESIDYGEFMLGASYGSFSAQYAYADDFFGGDTASQYISGAYDFSLPQDFTLTLQAGYSFDDAWEDFDGEYSDYSLTLAKTVNDFDLSLAYIDTDNSDVNTVKKDHNANDGRLVFSISKPF